MNLFTASEQWRARRADERFSSIEELHEACVGVRDHAFEAILELASLRVIALKDEIALVAVADSVFSSRLTHWSLGQLAFLAKAPAEYLRTLPAAVAAQALQFGIGQYLGSSDRLKLLFHRNGDLLLRALTSSRYARIYNADITPRFLELEAEGWMVPPARPAHPGQPGTRPATGDDVLQAGQFDLSVKIGDPIAPAGLYAGDRDMFVFMVDPQRPIRDHGSSLFRGFLCWNSEVGASSFGLTTFLWRHVCGNHIVWDAEGVEELRIVHVQNARPRAFEALITKLRKYAEAASGVDEARIHRARQVVLGETMQDVVAAIFELGIGALTQIRLEEAYQEAAMHHDTDGDPRTAWGMANGITRVSQKLPWADKRTALDRAAGRVLSHFAE